VVLMKVADLASDVGYKNLPEPVRTLSIENKGATKSPVPTLSETVSADEHGQAKDSTKIAEKLSKLSNRRLKFEYRAEADVYQITVVNEDEEVVRKIPADSILRVIENIERMRGISIDTRA
jgi:uncharacterized FlaG/YvyC family protein